MEIKIKNVWRHLRKIQTHRKWVRHYCFALGLYWQGLVHDLSKYSPVEFWESVKYYQGTSSPIDAAKKDMGYSMAWLHHRGRNFHHYENWMDNFDKGGMPLIMPYKYFAEMVCDYLAAARAYQGENFSFAAEREWWDKKKEQCAMAEDNKRMLNNIFLTLEETERAYGTERTEEYFCKTGKELVKLTYFLFVKEPK